MTVYVDDAQIPFGRMRMSHMMADTTEELLGMADRIGVQRRWLQYGGEPREHFDVAESKRRLALKAGAQLVTDRELVKRRRDRRDRMAEAISRLETD